MCSKILRKIVSALFLSAFLLVNSVSHAEIYTGEGKYIMSEGENLGVAKERAKADAMRNASEKAAVYVKSYTLTKNLMVEEDVIETMAATILKLIENPHFYPLEEVDNLEGVLIRVTVKVQIDDSDINRWLNKSEQEKSTLVSQNEALRKANEEQARQIAELKRQLANNTQDKEQITKKFAQEDKIFLSNQKVEEALEFFDRGDYNGAINLCNEAINLNSDNANAYFGRGTAYAELNQYETAISDYNNAIQLNPNLYQAYYNRGNAYFDLNQYEHAISDYSNAIQLNPNDYQAYYNRGNAYYNQNQYERAIQDYSKAIELNPKHANAYFNRGVAYALQQQYERALADYDKAIQLNPNDAKAYQLRGICYQELGDEAKAQADFAKAKQLGYKG